MGPILITGGGLYHNNGAQAMTFVAVSELRKRFPGCAICHMQHDDFLRSPQEKAQYPFEIRDQFSRRLLCHLSGWPFRAYALLRGVDRKQLAEAEALLNEADMVIDVSGFGFGTRWGMTKSLMLPLLVRAAKRHHARIYLMPQSFGPFDFPGLKGRIFNWFAARSFAKADAIFARESDGYNALRQRYHLKNVYPSIDMVLQNRGVEPGSVYLHPKPPKTLDGLGKSPVAVLPNKKLFLHGNPDNLLVLYRAVISRLLDQGHTVYLMRHAPQDARYCAMIYDAFAGDDRVSLIDEDFTSMDFENFLPSFEFLVTSRYHCVVHAYKRGVPCVVLGWAVKYFELLALFKQQPYVFDVCGPIDRQGIEQALDKMNADRAVESETIRAQLEAAQKENVFDILPSRAGDDFSANAHEKRG